MFTIGFVVLKDLLMRVGNTLFPWHFSVLSVCGCLPATAQTTTTYAGEFGDFVCHGRSALMARQQCWGSAL